MLCSLEKLESLANTKRYHNCDGMRNAIDLLISIYGGFSDEINSVYDTSWKLPPFYNVHRATLSDSNGNVLCDYSHDPLCLWSYSASYTGIITGSELLENHILTDKSRQFKTLFHFRLQYRLWESNWGFSLPWNVASKITPSENYSVDIRTEFTPQPVFQHVYGKPKPALNLILVAHLDHPSQLNDGLSGCLANLEVCNRLEGKLSHVNLISLSSVEIVGSVLFLKKYNLSSANTLCALCTNGLGLEQDLQFQYSSFPENSNINKIIRLFHHLYGSPDRNLLQFREGWGNDEVAFEVPGVEIPCPSIYRWPHPNYHSTDDSIEGFNGNFFESSVSLLESIILSIDSNYYITSINISSLACFASPDIGLYIEPGFISGKAVNSSSLNSLSSYFTAAELNYLNLNRTSINLFMNKLFPYLIHNPHPSVIDIADQFLLPPSFVLFYLQKIESLGLITLSTSIAPLS